MDFTLLSYKILLENLQKKFSSFSSLSNCISSSLDRYLVILRHDVDRLPNNALKMAEMENSLGIKGSYYFRIVPESFNVDIIKNIASLGHEIGYHYEDVDLIIKNYKLKIDNEPAYVGEKLRPGKKAKGKISKKELIDLAYESFCENLRKMREVADIKTICMHGSPRSKYDNKLIWSQRDASGTKYNYKDLGLIGEPYYDIDFNEFAYFTDTGRRWNGDKVSVRDKVDSKFKFDFKTTQDIIDNIDRLPEKVMFTIHPERWTDEMIPWVKQLVMQNVKNVVKRAIVKR